MIENIQFWKHPLIGGTGIQGLLETYFSFSFKEYDKTKVNANKKNVIIFFWETAESINLNFKTNNSDFIELLQELNDLGFIFLADYTTESNYHIDSERIEFLNKLHNAGINLNNFRLVTNNSDSSHFKIKYGEYEINHLYFPHFLLSTPLKMNEYVGDLNEYKSIKPTKDFLCLNRRVQEHKFKFVNRLSERGLIPYTNLSLVANKTSSDVICDSSLVKELNIDVDNFKSIQLEDDVMYGNNLDTADEYLYTINPKWYFDSKVNLIVETNVDNSPTHITEKTIKAIYLEKPFVVYGTSEHLNTLKNFGFTTFRDFIGNYDCTDIDSVINAGLLLSMVYDKPDIISSCKWNRENLLNINTMQQIIRNWFLQNI